MHFNSLFRNVSFYILFFSTVVATTILIWIDTTTQIPVSQAIKLDQIYGLIAVTFLYFALLATPLTRVFPNLLFAKAYLKIQRSLAISATLFSLLHSCFSFFGELGGFNGLGFLNDKYLFAMSLSAIALLILFLTTALSIDLLVKRLNLKRWLWISRYIYLAGLLIVVHVLILGTHFSDLSAIIPQIFFACLVILLGLESIRLDKFLRSKFQDLPSFSISFALLLIITSSTAIYLYLPSSGSSTSPFNIHAVHIQLAKQAQQGLTNLPNINPNLLNLPGLQGDRTRRFTASFSHPDNILPNQDTNLDFTVFDASSGNQVQLFTFVYSKLMHLVIVDNELQVFNHIHPTQTPNSHFLITTQFPHPGRYHLYINFQPLGAIEQQFAFTVDVGQVSQPATANQPVDTNLTKTFGKYQVSLTLPNPLKASEMSIGNQTISFNIKDATSGQPITTLKPYLAAFGHLVLVSEQTYDYLHVHPSNLFPPQPDANSGPNVDFIPLGLYGPIKPGIYRVFAQFNPDNQLFTADFTIKVE